MEGYRRDSYGEAFADVYDDWYGGLSDADSMVRLLRSLADTHRDGEHDGPPRLLELGVGTGRLAIPAADAGFAVTGLDSSEAMLGALRQAVAAGGTDANTGRTAVDTVHGDMVDDLPDGSFDVVLAAYNTLFNLESAERQQQLFAAVAQRLTADGHFVVEAFVPEDPPRAGDDVSVRSMSADRLVLSASVHDPEAQRAHGQFVELTRSGGVRLRPWSIRYAAPDELDAMAAASGLALEARTADAAGAPFDAHDSHQHVSVYRLVRSCHPG